MRVAILCSAMLLCNLCGCESLRTAKSDNPVIGPPPPRVANAARTRKRTFSAQAPEDEESRLADRDPDPEGIRPVNRTIASRPTFDDDMLVAKVNESPIFVRDLLEPYKPGLAKLRADIEKLKESPEYKTALAKESEIKEKLVRQSLPNAVEKRMLALAIRGIVKDAQFKQIQTAMEADYKQVEQEMMRKKEFNVTTSAEFQKKMREMGYDPVQFKQNKQESFLAQTYFQIKGRKPPEPDRSQMLAYYNEHADDYAFPAQVKWQQIQVSWSKHEGQEASRKQIEAAVDELLAGKPFPDVAQKYSDGLTAKEGGQWDWMKADTLADQELENRLFSMPVGEVSPIIESNESWQVVVVVERKAAGRKQFQELQDEIALKLKQKSQAKMIEQIIEDLRKDAVVWTVFDDDKPEENALPPEELPFK